MVRFVFTLEDLALTRFAISPMFELSDSLRALRAPDVAALHVPWIERLKGRLSDLDLGTALRLHQPRGYTPDFITPPPSGPLAEFGEEIELVRKVPAAQVRRDIEIYGRRHGWTPDIQAFVDHPRREARRLADTLEAYYEIAIAPYWPRIRALLQADIAHRSRELVQRGPAALFGSLHRNVDWQRDMVRVHQDFDDTVPLRGLGLLLLPSAFSATRPVTITEPPWQPTLVYPARGVGMLWEEGGGAPEALGRLLGATRAALLQQLDAPVSTTELARRLEMAAGGVSMHLRALRDAGLLTAERHGREVLYVRTELADELVAAA